MVEVNLERDSVDNLGHKVQRSQEKRMMRAATIGYNWAVEQAPEDRGQLKQTSFPPEWDGDILRWGFTQPYAKKQEFGTDPFYPELEPLLEWSKRKTGGVGLGYYVAREKIPTEGIDEKRFARDGKDRQRRAYDGESFEDIFEDELG